MTAFAKDNSKDAFEKMLAEICRANFLVATLMDEARVTAKDGPGQVTIEKGSRIKVFEVEWENGQSALPLFTDWDEIRRFTDQPVSTLVMPAHQVLPFAASRYPAIVIYAGGMTLPMLRDEIAQLAGKFAPQS
ncbi:MAG: SseB family protein [Phycisphaerales bacterium]|nr:SseB family protein [Phycisphaerales bacterium]